MEGTFIFVCDRGHVIVGDATISNEIGLHWHLKVSQTIRTWGTTKGLAELKNGPIEGSTVLDEVCERHLPFRSVIDIIHVTKEGENKWKASLYGKK